MRTTLSTLIVLLPLALADRPKLKDANGFMLVAMEDIGTSCGSDSYMGYGLVDDSLEKCENYSAVQLAAADSYSYEKWKCDNLRVNGKMSGDKCGCDVNWKGPICNVYHGCPDGFSLYNGVCTANICQHEGTMAVGTKGMECICKGEWDGKHCDRLSCWRKTDRGQDKRFRNDKGTNSCVCGVHYSGANCDTIVQCEAHGELSGSSCVCAEGWGGELCEKKCKLGEVTCGAFSTSAQLVLLLCVLLFSYLSH